MPNTLAHVVIGGILSRSILKNPDLKLVYLACVIPDVPWIIQRIVKTSGVDLDFYHLRAYSIVQSSFFVSIILCISLALFTRHFSRTVIVLILGCFVHIVLDATQIKWANGVHFLVPFNWNLSRFDFFWPENLLVHLITFLGLSYILVFFKEAITVDGIGITTNLRSVGLGFLFFMAWALIPVYFMPSVYENNNHYIDTLKRVNERSHKPIELDRNTYFDTDGVPVIQTAFGEKIELRNLSLPSNSIVSIQGVFIDPRTIYVEKFHVHAGLRDFASVIGLVLIAGIWLIFLSRTYYLTRRRQ